MIVFSQHITPRLRYILNFFAGEISNEEWTVTTNPDDFIKSPGVKINYSNEDFVCDCITIVPHTLLFEAGIMGQEIRCTEQNSHKIFFQNQSETGFDIFAASFYLLSRYEEYLPHRKDDLGRYAHEESLAFKEKFLQVPLINIWIQDLKALIAGKFPGYQFKQKQFTFLPTYDIDMAWSYKHKGFFRNIGGLVRDAIAFRFQTVFRRIKVLSGFENDPFDTFEWLDTLHEKYTLSARYFYLVAEHTSQKDKNISPHHAAMKQIIKEQSSKYPIGLHPSWQSNNAVNILNNEKNILEEIVEGKIKSSRQHYIKLALPQTYNSLIDAGLSKDFSMGYAGINGFRASVASPFKWYNLSDETEKELTLYPFCFMEGNSITYLHHTPQEGLGELIKLYHEVKSVNGFLIMIWHNSSFTNDGDYRGWRDVYENFLDIINVSGAYQFSYQERS